MATAARRVAPFPQLEEPVSFRQVEIELEQLCYAVEIYDFTVVMSEEVTVEHEQNPRRYAQVELGGDAPVFEFAAQTCWLPPEYRLGLYAHEIGHVLDPDPNKTEDGADATAFRALGVLIVYDHRWPGKGLQCAVPLGHA